MAVNRSLKSFAIIAIILEIFFAIIYAFEEGYVAVPTDGDFNGLLSAIYLIMLLLIGKLSYMIGFGLLTTYLK
jgi:hypothetical protein